MLSNSNDLTAIDSVVRVKDFGCHFHQLFFKDLTASENHLAKILEPLKMRELNHSIGYGFDANHFLLIKW